MVDDLAVNSDFQMVDSLASMMDNVMAILSVEMTDLRSADS